MSGIAAKVKDGFFIGDIETSQDPEFIELNKITGVINCAPRQISNIWEGQGVRYLVLDWEDDSKCMLFDNDDIIISRVARFIDEILIRGESVLVFSYRGLCRCIVCSLAYLIWKYSWGFDKAYSFVHNKRPDLDIKESFVQQLRAFDIRTVQKRFGNPQYMQARDKSRWGEWTTSYLSPSTTYDYNEINLDDEEIILVNSHINSRPVAIRPPAKESFVARHRSSIHWIDDDAQELASSILRNPESGKIVPERPPNKSYNSLNLGTGWSDLLMITSKQQIDQGHEEDEYDRRFSGMTGNKGILKSARKQQPSSVMNQIDAYLRKSNNNDNASSGTMTRAIQLQPKAAAKTQPIVTANGVQIINTAPVKSANPIVKILLQDLSSQAKPVKSVPLTSPVSLLQIPVAQTKMAMIKPIVQPVNKVIAIQPAAVILSKPSVSQIPSTPPQDAKRSPVIRFAMPSPVELLQQQRSSSAKRIDDRDSGPTKQRPISSQSSSSSPAVSPLTKTIPSNILRSNSAQGSRPEAPSPVSKAIDVISLKNASSNQRSSASSVASSVSSNNESSSSSGRVPRWAQTAPISLNAHSRLPSPTRRRSPSPTSKSTATSNVPPAYLQQTRASYSRTTNPPSSSSSSRSPSPKPRSESPTISDMKRLAARSNGSNHSDNGSVSSMNSQGSDDRQNRSRMLATTVATSAPTYRKGSPAPRSNQTNNRPRMPLNPPSPTGSTSSLQAVPVLAASPAVKRMSLGSQQSVSQRPPTPPRRIDVSVNSLSERTMAVQARSTQRSPSPRQDSSRGKAADVDLRKTNGSRSSSPTAQVEVNRWF